MDARVQKSIREAQRLGLRIVLGRPETPPPGLGWWAHLAPTVDIIPLQEGPILLTNRKDRKE